MRKTLPFELKIAKPCQQSWQDMAGKATERHCSSCNKSVHNLAAMSPRGILKVLAESDGHLCARITRRADGSIVTADASDRRGLSSKAAGLLVGAALSAGAAAAQNSAGQSEKAIVSGVVRSPVDKKLTDSPEILFIQDGKLIEKVTTNADGNWQAHVVPGKYDVVFQTGPFYGERVNAVELHAGEQSFAAVDERFDYGHLGMQDNVIDTYQEIGDVVTVVKYPALFYLRHPLRYMKSLRHNFG